MKVITILSILIFISSAYGTIVKVEPLSSTVNKGSLVKVDIKIEGVQDLYGFQLDLNYDSSTLELKEIFEGDFLNENGSNNTFWLEPKKSPGCIKEIACCRMISRGNGVSGGGILASLAFTAKSEGLSTIDLNAIKLSDSKAKSIESTAMSNNIRVSSLDIAGVIPPEKDVPVEEKKAEVPKEPEKTPLAKEPEKKISETPIIVSKSVPPSSVSPGERTESIGIETISSREITEIPSSTIIESIIDKPIRPDSYQIKSKEETKAIEVSEDIRAEQIRSIAEALAKIEKPEIKKASSVKENKKVIMPEPAKRPNLFILAFLGLTVIQLPWTIKALRWYW